MNWLARFATLALAISLLTELAQAIASPMDMWVSSSYENVFPDSTKPIPAEIEI